MLGKAMRLKSVALHVCVFRVPRTWEAHENFVFLKANHISTNIFNTVNENEVENDLNKSVVYVDTVCNSGPSKAKEGPSQDAKGIHFIIIYSEGRVKLFYTSMQPKLDFDIHTIFYPGSFDSDSGNDAGQSVVTGQIRTSDQMQTKNEPLLDDTAEGKR